jgi:hypothetical protein
MTYYNVFNTSKGARITKWDENFNPTVSYLVSDYSCECPARDKPCKHMKMLTKFRKDAAFNVQTFYCPEEDRYYDLA